MSFSVDFHKEYFISLKWKHSDKYPIHLLARLQHIYCDTAIGIFKIYYRDREGADGLRQYEIHFKGVNDIIEQYIGKDVDIKASKKKCSEYYAGYLALVHITFMDRLKISQFGKDV